MLDQLLKKGLKTKSFSKGEMLQREGQKSAKVFIVKKGLLRSYIIDEKGKEHIYMFASEGWLASDIESQSFKSNTVLFIDAIEDSEVYILEPSDLTPNAESLEDYNLIVDTLMKRMGVMQRRILSLMSASARERYESFLQIYPELPNRVPLKMIAAYLGITPEALSTIRNKIAKNR
ncbi:Crp/Fnr family transcriptional regulator [Fulvivirga sp.]|uniref:Crp/Fnr family transcriptional regulator n=1 Tax=Fulvivirga sp. TaxID=1931237 RepID=UPI0032EA96D2